MKCDTLMEVNSLDVILILFNFNIFKPLCKHTQVHTRCTAHTFPKRKDSRGDNREPRGLTFHIRHQNNCSSTSRDYENRTANKRHLAGKLRSWCASNWLPSLNSGLHSVRLQSLFNLEFGPKRVQTSIMSEINKVSIKSLVQAPPISYERSCVLTGGVAPGSTRDRSGR